MGRTEEIREEDVISKLKDDGDFDRIRLNIVRLLKQNEDLRNNISLAVKECAAINHAGAESMTARQLCDAIHDELSENVMVQISDGLWKIIRSEESIKTEITETVQSVYDKLLRPEGESPIFTGDMQPTISDGEDREPPGFSLQNHNSNKIDISHSEKPVVGPSFDNTSERRGESFQSNGSLKPDGEEDGDTSPPPGFVLHGKRKRSSDGDDDDLDIPPGFG